MRERARVFGGELHAGPRAQGGYLVAARLPLRRRRWPPRPSPATTRRCSELAAGIRVVAGGEALLAPSITKRLIQEFAAVAPAVPEPPRGMDELTARELEVFELVARGLSNAEIAAELIVSDTTVKTHVARLLMKLGLRDRV